MTEDAAATLALDAYQVLQGIGGDVAQLKGQNSDVLAAIESLRQSNVEGFQALIARDGEISIASDAPADDGSWVTEVHSSAEVPETFFTDLMAMQYMQVAVSVFLLVALLLNLGVNLFSVFYSKWR